MTEQDFEKAKDFLKQVVEGTNQFGFCSGEMGIFFNPDNLCEEKAKRDWLKHSNDGAPFIFEENDIVFVEAINPENNHKVYIEKLSPELIAKTKAIMKKDK